MPRANRSFLPGHIWHLTHRCHKKEYLLKFRKDKRLWMRWALEAKARYGLFILNFMITSNHIHLLATLLGSRWGRGPISALSRALQLIESRVAQTYNARKERHGAFWEDRYHATAIEDGPQLRRCLTYIDMNMVRACVVDHPRDWPWCGYHELGREAAASVERRRGFLVDSDKLMHLLGVADIPALLARRSQWIDDAIRKGRIERDPIWTESLAVGSETFLKDFQVRLGSRIGVSEIGSGGPDNDLFFLKRTRHDPLVVFGAKNDDLGP